jgi:hypothetical protein
VKSRRTPNHVSQLAIYRALLAPLVSRAAESKRHWSMCPSHRCWKCPHHRAIRSIDARQSIALEPGHRQLTLTMDEPRKALEY